MEMKFMKLDSLPVYELMKVGSDGMPLPAEHDVPRWSGKRVPAPPKIGERIKVSMNSLGPAIVLGYFTEAGFLGLRVKLESPPAWWTKQNAKAITAGEVESHVFGAEISPL